MGARHTGGACRAARSRLTGDVFSVAGYVFSVAGYFFSVAGLSGSGSL